MRRSSEAGSVMKKNETVVDERDAESPESVPTSETENEGATSAAIATSASASAESAPERNSVSQSAAGKQKKTRSKRVSKSKAGSSSATASEADAADSEDRASGSSGSSAATSKQKKGGRGKSSNANQGGSGGGSGDDGTVPNLTPAMRQWKAFKDRFPECVLFFRMGDFYEVFYEDAELCHRVLGITLTQRSEGVPMAGVPFHSAESYLRKMIEQGHRVAVADQVQDPKEAKGVVDRAVTRIVTPGTLVDETLLDDARSNHVAAVLFTGPGNDAEAAIAVAELSTGHFELMNVPNAEAARDELARLGADELLFASTATGDPPERVQHLADLLNCSLTPRPGWHFRHEEAFESITERYGVTTLSGFGLADDDPAIGPAGALIRYFEETQALASDLVRQGTDGTREHGSENVARAKALGHLRPPQRRNREDYLVIDAVSLRSLEIERTMRTGSTAGSLVGSFRSCTTPMGRRLLVDWLCYPLRDRERIERRQRAVGAFVDDAGLCEQFVNQAKHIADVARIGGRLGMNRATPKDLVALGRSLSMLRNLIDLIADRPAFTWQHRRLSACLEALHPLGEKILKMCDDEETPSHMREGGLIRDGVDAELDEARDLMRNGQQWLVEYQRDLIEETGIPSLKVGYNKVFGYYIEVTAVHSSKVPDAFTRKQTLKNAERYITPVLKEYETRVLNAEQRAIDREQDLFNGLCREAATHQGDLDRFSTAVAELDVLHNFADRAIRRGFIRPDIVDQPVLDIRGGRHPVLDEMLRDRFVPNNCMLGVAGTGEASSEDASADAESDAYADDEINALDQRRDVEGRPSLALITGPNMAGKSTYIRQVALLTLLAHTGCWIPAESATIGITDRIFTRIGASDELHAGRSTFMVEMVETANIVHHATERSLVVLDEIGRGTSTLDGLSLAWAIAEELAHIGSRTLFATHYHELTEIADRLPSVVNWHVTVREWKDEIIFLYRTLPGRADKSYGIHVAKIAGMPTNIVSRAQHLLDRLEVHTANAAAAAAASSPAVGDGHESADSPSPAAAATIAASNAAAASSSDEDADGGGRGRGRRRGPGSQLTLFTEFMPHPAIERLREIELERLTPLEAFEVLRRLKLAAENDGPG
ncbi:MAG: DNA mismatch repair protein MutS [Planctomycetota bacterium]